VYSRRILGWRVASSMTTALVTAALEQSLFTRRRTDTRFTATGLVHHSDYAVVGVKPRNRGIACDDRVRGPRRCRLGFTERDRTNSREQRHPSLPTGSRPAVDRRGTSHAGLSRSRRTPRRAGRGRRRLPSHLQLDHHELGQDADQGRFYRRPHARHHRSPTPEHPPTASPAGPRRRRIPPTGSSSPR
jgi:hypothetical protein